jgi:hypothetical protein
VSAHHNGLAVFAETAALQIEPRCPHWNAHEDARTPAVALGPFHRLGLKAHEAMVQLGTRRVNRRLCCQCRKRPVQVHNVCRRPRESWTFSNISIATVKSI